MDTVYISRLACAVQHAVCMYNGTVCSTVSGGGDSDFDRFVRANAGGVPLQFLILQSVVILTGSTGAHSHPHVPVL